MQSIPSTGIANPRDMPAVGGRLCFFKGPELWTADGMAGGTTRLRKYEPDITYRSSIPMAAIGNVLYCGAYELMGYRS